MLGSSELVAFVPATDLVRAGAFYRDALGLEARGETPIALLFDAHRTPLRVTLVDALDPAGYTVLGWSVDAIDEVIRGLVERGVAFERFPGIDQDDLGVWTTPGGDRVAWFRDPDGNLLSVTQPA